MVTITKFRKNLFELVGYAMQGEPLEFTHKGVVFKVTAEGSQPKLSRLIPQTVVAPGADFDSSGLLHEMESEWQKDWSEL